MASRPDRAVDIVLVGDHPLTATIGLGSRCPMCRHGFKPEDAAVRVRDYSRDGVGELAIHRRCIEAALATGPEDAPTAQSKFDAYRTEVAEKLGIPVG